MLMNFRQDVYEMAGEGKNEVRTFDPASIIAIFNLVSGLIGQLVALCNKTPPAPPPVPADLAAEGVSETAWTKAYQAQWAANEGWLPNKGRYRDPVVNHAAAAVAKDQGGKKKLQKTSVVAAFNRARLEDVKTLARAAHENGQ